MYFATSISHLPISRFISCSTMLQRYVVFLKLPNNSEKKTHCSHGYYCFILSLAEILFSRRCRRWRRSFHRTPYTCHKNLRNPRNLREIKNMTPARIKSKRNHARDKLHAIHYPLNVILNIISIEVHKYPKLLLRELQICQ